MPLRSLRIFVSSLGDVAKERLIARRVIGRLEAQFGLSKAIALSKPAGDMVPTGER